MIALQHPETIEPFVRSGLQVNNPEKCINITNVSVLPALQRRGIGTQMMQVFLATLPSGSEVFLHVDKPSHDANVGQHNRLVRWYEGLQFKAHYTNCVETCMYHNKK